jgi:hypothetical protein
VAVAGEGEQGGGRGRVKRGGGCVAQERRWVVIVVGVGAVAVGGGTGEQGAGHGCRA